MPETLWSEEDAPAGALEQLVYRSNLLGRDRAIVNYGGGNTSSKGRIRDHRGREIEVMWIKGSGSDLETVGRAGFPALHLDDLRAAQANEAMTDEEMVEYVAQCSAQAGGPRPSIETMLHAFLPFAHVDHTHPEAAIAMCCCSRGEELMRECFGDDVVWVPYVRPGFALAKLALDALHRNPNAKGMLLAKHGLVTWGQTGRDSYDGTIELLSQAERFLEASVNPEWLYGGRSVDSATPGVRQAVMGELLPVIRGELSRLVGSDGHVILNFDDSEAVLEFACSRDAASLAGTGAACPDHVMYTKFLPLVVDASECRTALIGDSRALTETLREVVTGYVHRYTEFFETFSPGGVSMLNPGPRVILIPGFGLVTAGVDAWAARNTRALYRTAIRVMRWASSIGDYTSLSSQEGWDIEYWPLELYKLTLRPPPKEMASRIVVVTGGAGAIGRATAARLLSEGAHVVLSDIDPERLAAVVEDLRGEHLGRVHAVVGDAVSESQVSKLFCETILTFGGVDLVVPNAGLASSAPVDETAIDEWDRVQAVLLRGYFLACRAAFVVMKRQGIGGAIVINSSKNGLAAGPNAIAYTTAKAAELHMARCLAEEGGRFGIRVNAVAPDAVIRGSGLWTQKWREERAKAYGFEVSQIEEHYRERNVLKVSITAEDVAEAILFLASRRSSKTTGCIITIDGGLAVAYPR
jgi:rhamnulose-1-phosphate aldolase/alcohol dehydrogenase